MSKEEEEVQYDLIDNLDIPLEEDDEELSELDRGDSLDDEDEDEAESEDEEVGEEPNDVEEKDATEEEDKDGDLENEVENKIPLSRLNQVIAQRDEQKDRVSFLEGQLEMAEKLSKGEEEKTKATPEVTPPFDYGKAEREAAEYLLEGESEKYNDTRELIRKEQQKEFTQQILDSQNAMRESAKADLSDRDFNKLVDSLEQDNTFLDSASDDYNEEATDMVNSLMSGYLSNGLPRDEALIKAVDKLSPLFGEESPTVEPKLGETKKQRDIKSRKRVVAAIKGQPAKLNGVKGSQDLGDADIASMSDKDFASMSLKEKKAQRGD